jgi:hypothetical protein
MALLHELVTKENGLKQKIISVYGKRSVIDDQKALQVNMEVAKLVGLKDPKEAFTYINCLNTYWMAQAQESQRKTDENKNNGFDLNGDADKVKAAMAAKLSAVRKEAKLQQIADKSKGDIYFDKNRLLAEKYGGMGGREKISARIKRFNLNEMNEILT